MGKLLSAISPSIGGAVIERAGFSASFLSLGAIAAVAFAVLLLSVPETRVQVSPSLT